VLASSKRRASLYTLPIVVLVGFGTVAGLAAWQRADVIADLADQVAHGDTTEATAAVRQLAAIPRPPLSLLVEAATSDERATAEAAQIAINGMLGQWQRQVDKQQRLGSVASQITELATSLAAHRREFAAADYPWLSGATRKIVKIANRCPPKKTPLVALHCDEIMSVVERRPAIRSKAMASDELENQRDQNVTATAGKFNRAAAPRPPLEQDFSDFPTWRMSTDPAARAADAAPIESPPVQQPATPANDADPATPSANERQVPPEPAAGENVGQQQPQDRTAQPSWSQPMFRIVPPDAPTTAETPTPPRPLPSIPLQAVPANPRARALETRGLLQRWRDSNGNETQFIEHDLATRGFKRLPPRLVEQYLSDDAEARLRLVDSVLAERNIDARPWLALLADDENADVRLAAVTVMATSDDKSLVEKAWQVAIRDRDPRIAGLAGRLRERRR